MCYVSAIQNIVHLVVNWLEFKPLISTPPITSGGIPGWHHGHSNMQINFTLHMHGLARHSTTLTWLLMDSNTACDRVQFCAETVLSNMLSNQAIPEPLTRWRPVPINRNNLHIFWICLGEKTLSSPNFSGESSVYTRCDITARCRGMIDAGNGLQRNPQGRLH